MTQLLDFAISLTRAWVAAYTRGLPGDLGAERREEIDCDLWEQQWLATRRGDPALGTAIEVLARMLLGVISDLTWRAQAGSTARADRSIKMSESWYMRGFLTGGVVLALLLVLAGIGAGADALLDPDTADGDAAVAAVFAIAGAAVLFGLLTSRRNPVLGIGLVAAGAITVAVIFYWLLLVTVPIGIALVAITFFRARSTGWPRGGPAPTGTA